MGGLPGPPRATTRALSSISEGTLTKLVWYPRLNICCTSMSDGGALRCAAVICIACTFLGSGILLGIM